MIVVTSAYLSSLVSPESIDSLTSVGSTAYQSYWAIFSTGGYTDPSENRLKAEASPDAVLSERRALAAPHRSLHLCGGPEDGRQRLRTARSPENRCCDHLMAILSRKPVRMLSTSVDISNSRRFVYPRELGGCTAASNTAASNTAAFNTAASNTQAFRSRFPRLWAALNSLGYPYAQKRVLVVGRRRLRPERACLCTSRPKGPDSYNDRCRR